MKRGAQWVCWQVCFFEGDVSTEVPLLDKVVIETDVRGNPRTDVTLDNPPNVGTSMYKWMF